MPIMPSLRAAIFICLLFCAVSTTAKLTSRHTIESVCAELGEELPDEVLHPGSAVFDYENQEFWSNTKNFSPNICSDLLLLTMSREGSRFWNISRDNSPFEEVVIWELC
jgi:hypothetical protein